MKGWVKGMLIGAGACLATGSVMCVGAWAMGGRFSHYRNRGYGVVEQWLDEDLEQIEVYEEATVKSRDDGAGRSGENGSRREEEASTNDSRGSAAEAKSGGTIVRELEIEVVGGFVEIVTDDSSDQIVVASGNEDYQCRQELEEDKLEIYVGLNSGLWQNWLVSQDDMDFDDDGLAARIVIPAGAAFSEVDLEVKGGGLRMDQVTAQKLNLDLEAGVLKVSTSSVQKLNGECKAGELIFQGQIGQEMEAKCVTGSVQYLIEGEPEDFRYEVESAAGSVTIDGVEKGILNQENIIDNPGAVKKAKLECKAGAVNVEFQ